MEIYKFPPRAMMDLMKTPARNLLYPVAGETAGHTYKTKSFRPSNFPHKIEGLLLLRSFGVFCSNQLPFT